MTKRGNQPKADQSITITPDSTNVFRHVNVNISQEVIVVTRDKVELCLSKHVKSMEQRKEWTVPAGIFITAVTTLFSATFQPLWGIRPEVWQSAFFVGAVVNGCWLAVALFKMPRAKSVDHIIAELKAGGVVVTSAAGTTIAETPPAPPTGASPRQ